MSEAPAQVSYRELFKTFLVIGATSFGGGVIAYLREHLIARRGWLSDDDFMAALEISETCPGLISTNMSIVVGTRLLGPLGSVIAFLGIAVPGTIVVLTLGLLYGHFEKNADVNAVLNGVSAAAVGLLLAVTIQLGRKQFASWLDLCFLAPAFVLVGVLHIPMVPVLAVLAPLAVLTHRPRPRPAALPAASAEGALPTYREESGG